MNNSKLSSLSIKNMKKEIYGYGYDFSWLRFAMLVVCSLGITITVGYFYEIGIVGLIIVSVTCVLCVPSLMVAHYKEQYQKRRFGEVDIYLHQMSYSFLKNPKIILALEDTMRVSTGKLKDTIKKAIDELETSSSANVYEECLDIIANEYNCSRIKALHRFMLRVEEKGGDYKNSLNIMLSDIDIWINRTYAQQRQISGIKKSTVFGLALGLILGGVSIIFSNIMVPQTSQISNATSITNDELYIITSIVFLCITVLYFTFVQRRFVYDWVSFKVNDQDVIRDYKNATEFQALPFMLKSIPIYAFFILMAIIVYFIEVIPYREYIAAFLLFVTVVLVITPLTTKRSATVAVRRHIQDAFSEWLRDVSLNLQFEPLIPAIEESYETCPVVLKPELELFLSRVLENPTDVEPFFEFLARFHLVDINSAVRNLYSISENSDEESGEQLNRLIERNYELMQKNDENSAKDRDALLRFSEVIPIFIALAAMSIDMLCLITNMI